MVLQSGQTPVQGSPQQGISRDEAVDLQPLRLQSGGAVPEKFRVQPGLRAGVEVVHGDDGASACRQPPCGLRGGGGGVYRNGHLLRQRTHLLQREAVVQPQPPQLQLLRQCPKVGAAKLPHRLFGHVRKDMPALFCQKMTHLLHPGAVIGVKFFADVQ